MPLAKHTYSKMNQDLAKAKYPNEVYYEGRNIRVLTNSDYGAITNVKGNELVIEIPMITENPSNKEHLNFINYPITNLEIIGHTSIDDILIILSKSDNLFAVHKIDTDYNIDLIFFDEVPISYPVDVKGYFENENIQKIYFADGENELRFLNIADPDLINLDSNFISSVPDINLTNPEVTGFVSGGIHTAGMIQYAYNLYNINGAQTKISPVSSLVPLNNGNKGNQVNDQVSKSPVVRIEDIDQDYEFVRLYSIKYTSLNSTPEIKILLDEPITDTTLEITDDNNALIQIITLSEFTFLGGDIYIPLHINIKDKHLFIANYKTIPFDFDFDTRAYSYDNTGSTELFDKDGNSITFSSSTIPEIEETYDAINPSIKADEQSEYYNKYIYDDSGQLGGIGPNIKYSIKYKTVNTNFGDSTMDSDISFATDNQPNRLLSLKTGETYRIGIEFLNNKGQWSFAKWIADVKIPEITSSNRITSPNGIVRYCYIEVELLNQPSQENISGWRVLRVERTQADKTVLTQGFLNPTIRDNKSPGFTIYPSYFTRTFRNNLNIPDYNNPINNTTSPSQDLREYIYPMRYNTSNDIEGTLSSNDGPTIGSSDPLIVRYRREILSDDRDYIIEKNFNTFHSPEIIKDKNNFNISQGDKIRYLGLVLNTHSRSSRQIYGPDGILLTSSRDNSALLSYSAVETHPGATVLAQLSFDPATDNREHRDRVATYKVIAAYNHEGTDDNYLYSRLRYSYVRYFNGFEFVNNDLQNRMETIETSTPYVAPIEGVRNFVFGDLNISYNPNMQFITKFNNNDLIVYRPVTFRAYGGSAILLRISNIESKFPEITNDNGDYLPVIEIVRDNINQYGGNTYSARQRNRYIPFSDLVNITDTAAECYKGDTYIQKFNYLKTFKSEEGRRTITEIVSIPLESSVNLDMRYDILKENPDNKDADENTSYGFNDVYQQNNNIIRAIPKPPVFQEINNFPLDVIPSKLKFSGELIDSFTDFLINDKITMEGRYGPITALPEFNDNLFVFQRNAIAYLAINPRVQISATDGIPIELGSGRLIERYQYISTNSGTLNKWSIAKTNNGLIYFDLLSKTLNFFGGEGVQKVSTLNGMYNRIKNFSESYKDTLMLDNPYDNSGVISHFNNNEEDTYITFLTPEDKFTLVYNGLAQGFTSIVDFTPSVYLNLNNRMITSIDRSSLWEHGKGEYQTFYGDYFPAHITIVFNDHGDISKITDNIHFNSYFSIDNVDIPNVTFNKLKVWNDFQDTGERNIIVNKRQAGKRHRRYNFIIPRVENSRDRIFNHWSLIKLEFDKTLLKEELSEEDYKFVLNDLIISYTIGQ